MRNLSANALAQIATKLGNEPVTIVEIDWIEDNAAKLYADRDIGSISGKILEVSSLDNVININDNDSSQEISITLDDTDGTIKEILNTNDIHKRSARVYQFFSGMDFDDRFLLFAGKISSPITWSERQRTISFTIISQLEDKEVGFSAEEGQFPWIPKDLIGKSWPMIFGTVQDVPCLQFNHAVTGTTMCGVGIISGQDEHLNAPLGGNDSAFYVSMTQMNAQIFHLWDCWRGSCDSEAESKDKFQDQANKAVDRRIETAYQHEKSKECARLQRVLTLETAIAKTEDGGADGLGCNPVRILGGEDFPQGVGLQLTIGQGIFTGYFEGENFHISDRLHEVNEEKAFRIGFDNWGYWKAFREFNDLCASEPPFAEWKFETQLVCVSFPTSIVHPDGIIKTEGSAYGTISEDETDTRKDQIAQHYWAQAGSSVGITSSEPITYVASIVPGTVLAVKAYKTFESERLLVNVPDDLYVVETVDYGPVTAVQITIDKPLSTITDQGWEDNLYVTFESDIGPHTCDILQYIIDNYTDLEYDGTSFTEIRTKLDPFPMNFPILDKKNALDVLQEIAFQARCALWLSNGTFYIKYLPEEPSSDQTITVSDIDAEEGLTVELTSTEDLVTRMNVEWRISWNEDEPNKIILRHNVKKYGTQAEDFFFYCFNQPDIVLKAATFWLIRKSNTWKKVSFKAYLQLLNLEVFDTVLLSLGSDYVSTGDVKAVVDEAKYNSDDQTIDFTVSTPIKSGTMVEYEFYWPSQIAVSAKFPTDFELENGYAGGNGIGAGATGDLPIGFTDPDDWGDGVVWVGGPNVVFTGPADHGESTPSDIDFVAQPVIFTDQYAELDVTSNPNPNLLETYARNTPLLDLLVIGDSFFINLYETKVVDMGENGTDTPKYAPLSTFFKSVNEDDKLTVDCDESLWSDTEHEDGSGFHFKYDEEANEGEEFGAGTAWLKE